jgi:hypothetical protein
MLWQYTRRDTKKLLFATLCIFSAYGFLLGASWQDRIRTVPLTASTVGVLAAVPQNEANTLLAQLEEREHAIEVREAMLAERSGNTTDETTLLLVTIVGAGLLGLILLNFYLDSRRRVSLNP